MKRTNLKSLGELRPVVEQAGAEEMLRKRNYVTPFTTISRVLMEMDVLAGANSTVCTEGYVSSGKSVSAGNPFKDADAFTGEFDVTGW